MEEADQGPKSTDFIPEVGEDAVNAVPSSPYMALTEEEQAELHSELAKVEDEIQTLSQVLEAKEKQVADIKRKLGITPLNEFKQNLSKGWQEVTTSTAYKKTSETLSQVGQKATTAFSSVGSAISRKLEDVRPRLALRQRQAILKRFQNPHLMESQWLNTQRELVHRIKKRIEDPPSNAPLFFLLLTSCPSSSTPQQYFYIVTVSFVLWPYFSTGVWVISRLDVVVLHWNRCVRM
uniref:Tumor protein D52-like n=1 Tax=Cyprinus carpio TaxID=7962 RepID=A0A8C1Q0X5_CYPCA